MKKEITIKRIWAMPNKYTFQIKPIKNLLERHTEGIGADPFADKNIIAKVSNKIAESHICALEFLKNLESNYFDWVVYDPPYSITQARKYGHKKFSSMKYWADVKNEIKRVIKTGGKAICCGWSSMGIGKTRGFEMIEILLVPHGGSKNDTIVTVEIKK